MQKISGRVLHGVAGIAARRVSLAGPGPLTSALGRVTWRHTTSSKPAHSVDTPPNECELKVQELLQSASERVPFVFPEDAVKLYQEGECVFVDVREPPEWFGTGLVKEALPVPRGVLEFTVADQLDLNRRIVLYCSNGYRAALAGSTMMDLGFSSVLNGGSFEALVDAGIDVEDAAKVSRSQNLKEQPRRKRTSRTPSAPP